MATTAEQRAMARAIELAEASGRTHPNPRVGAVLLDPAGNQVGEGMTEPWPGLRHGEVRALEAAGTDRPGLTMVVTLEPCNHQGRTGPCTEAIIAAGIARVVVGAIDPDPRVSGRGIERLRRTGIEVETGLMAPEVESADPAYFHHRRTGRPYLILKTAITLDGATAALDGSSQWITGPEARADTHRLRSRVDAIMIGAGTLRSDDPLLTARVDDHEDRQPVAVVVAGNKPLPAAARLWDRPDTVVIATEGKDVPVEWVKVDAAPGGLPDPAAVVAALHERGLVAVLVEGGAALAGSLWRAGLIDAGVTYLGAMLAGGMGRSMLGGHWLTLADAESIEITAIERLGRDLRLDWKRQTSPPVQE